MHQFSDKGNNFDFLDPNSPKIELWGRNLKHLTLDLESAPLRYYVHQFSEKRDTFELLGLNFHKNGFWARNFKNLSLDWKSTTSRYHRHQFSSKTNNFKFLGTKFAHKSILKSKFHKSKSGFGMRILEILCTPIFTQNEQLWVFQPKFPKKMDFGLNISKI